MIPEIYCFEKGKKKFLFCPNDINCSHCGSALIANNFIVRMITKKEIKFLFFCFHCHSFIKKHKIPNRSISINEINFTKVFSEDSYRVNFNDWEGTTLVKGYSSVFDAADRNMGAGVRIIDHCKISHNSNRNIQLGFVDGNELLEKKDAELKLLDNSGDVDAFFDTLGEPQLEDQTVEIKYIDKKSPNEIEDKRGKK